MGWREGVRGTGVRKRDYRLGRADLRSQGMRVKVDPGEWGTRVVLDGTESHAFQMGLYRF